ncbi:MAG: hypothetical protein AB1782_18830 [Cyanobacteriota bacterium]
MDETKLENEPIKFDEKSFNYKRKLGFGIFGVFFTYYIACAIIQAPEFQSISSIPLFGMPLGFVLSMGIFPISWILLIIFFIYWR